MRGWRGIMLVCSGVTDGAEAYLKLKIFTGFPDSEFNTDENVN
jgi:hypothetical protein